jgi:hypothetical protein
MVRASLKTGQGKNAKPQAGPRRLPVAVAVAALGLAALLAACSDKPEVLLEQARGNVATAN